MLYYTIYLKNLHNNSGYIDLALENDQLLKDYIAFLDLGMKASNRYSLAASPGMKARGGSFVVNLADIAAITVTAPQT
jgi:hypothetical protein